MEVLACQGVALAKTEGEFEKLMKIIYYIITLIIGAAYGWLFYKFIGCRSGGWPITSNVWLSVILGALFGYLLLSPIVEHYLKKNILKQRIDIEQNDPKNNGER